MAAGDASPLPKKNVAYRATFSILDADRDLVTGAADLDSEFSGDAAGFADCTNEATEIATASGVYYLDLTAAEMNYDTVAVIVKTSTADAKTTVLVIYPQSDPLSFYSMYAGPHGPGVWIDDAAANTDTVVGVDGTPLNPVSTIAAATTLATALGLQRFYLINDTAITLAQTYEGYEFIGLGEIMANVITLGSQDVDNSHFENVLLAGTQGGTGRLQARRCALGTLVSLELTARDCLITGPLTVRDDCAFEQCSSTVAGTGVPTLDINSVASVNIYCRHYSGGLQIDNAVSTTVMSYESDGQLIIDATCTSLTIVVRGNCTITDNGTTTVLTQDAAVTLASINAEVVDALVTDTHAEPASVPAATSSIKDMLHWLFTLARNKGMQTSATKTLRNDADGANIGTAPISDDGTTFTRGEWV